jgi:hypothetical protein
MFRHRGAIIRELFDERNTRPAHLRRYFVAFIKIIKTIKVLKLQNAQS